jgi:hypothetical protein
VDDLKDKILLIQKITIILQIKTLTVISCWALMVDACNLSYSGGRNQEDRGLKSAQVNSSLDPIMKIPITKKDWWGDSRCRP